MQTGIGQLSTSPVDFLTKGETGIPVHKKSIHKRSVKEARGKEWQTFSNTPLLIQMAHQRHADFKRITFLERVTSQEHFPVDDFRASLPSRELNISIGLEMVRSVRAERKVVKAPIWYKNIFFIRHSSRAALRSTISAAHSMV